MGNVLKNYSTNYYFLDQSKCFLDSQFDFRPHHSTNKTLRTITEQITYVSTWQEQLYTWSRFLKGGWYYLTNRKQHAIINGVSSSFLSITHRVPQGSFLRPLLFLIYINDLSHVVKHSIVRHFADGTNFLYSSSSLKLINKCINHDLKWTVHLLQANGISLNVNKPKIILFWPKIRQSARIWIFA